jgi:hypothetical protein
MNYHNVTISAKRINQFSSVAKITGLISNEQNGKTELSNYQPTYDKSNAWFHSL